MLLDFAESVVPCAKHEGVRREAREESCDVIFISNKVIYSLLLVCHLPANIKRPSSVITIQCWPFFPFFSSLFSLHSSCR